jgi:hypothetical protein
MQNGKLGRAVNVQRDRQFVWVNWYDEFWAMQGPSVCHRFQRLEVASFLAPLDQGPAEQ